MTVKCGVAEGSQLCDKAKQRKRCRAKQYKRWRILTGVYCYAKFLKESFFFLSFNLNKKWLFSERTKNKFFVFVFMNLGLSQATAVYPDLTL